jgi:membrane associated rhomboid family serine protease
MFPLGDTIPRVHLPLVTWALILLNGLVFAIELALPPAQRENAFYLFGLVPARFEHPAWAAWVGFPAHTYWPFLTSMFLHGGWLHIIGNMWFLWIFGDNVEDRMGPARFLMFYLLCGIIAAIVHTRLLPNSTLPTVGASGAIAGVMGAYLVMFPRARIITLVLLVFWPLFFELPAVVFLGVWFLIQFFSGAAALASPEQVGGIAFWAHVGGFGAGVALHRLFLVRRWRPRERQQDELGVEGIWGHGR